MYMYSCELCGRKIKERPLRYTGLVDRYKTSLVDISSRYTNVTAIYVKNCYMCSECLKSSKEFEIEIKDRKGEN